MNIGGLVKNSFVDYPKKICCVIFTNGCNMNCWYCHNNHLINNKTPKISEQEIFNFLKSHKPFLDAVTISGGEPTLQPDLASFIKKIKDMGFLIKLDTNGTNFEILKNLIESNLLDYVSMDVKAPINKYNLISSKVNIDDIKKSIEFLKQGKVDYEFRTTLCPSLTKQDILDIAKLLQGAKNYSLQQYKVPEHIKKDESNLNQIKFSESEVLQIKKHIEGLINSVTLKGF